MSEGRSRGRLETGGNPARTAVSTPRFGNLYPHLAQLLANRNKEAAPKSLSLYWRGEADILAVARGHDLYGARPVVAFGGGIDAEAALKALDKAVQAKKWRADEWAYGRPAKGKQRPAP